MTDIPPPFDILWVKLLLGFIVGICLGSFTTVLIYRLPRGLSLITPRSHCPACKTQLGTLDLVPIFSWLTSRGRCRHCGVSIGRSYVYVELAMGVMGALALAAIGYDWKILVALIAQVVVVTLMGIRLSIR